MAFLFCVVAGSTQMNEEKLRGSGAEQRRLKEN
jgi:hypothetical protein